MRVLVVHNNYRQPGGEDEVAKREAALLRSRGHDVKEFHRSNAETQQASGLAAGLVALESIWSRQAATELSNLAGEFKADVVHFHNTFHRISPSAYRACRQHGAAVVQTIHNPRFLCPSATFWRKGRLCVDCLKSRAKFPGVRHGCYHGTTGHTIMAAGFTAISYLEGVTWKQVDLFLLSTHFYHKLFMDAGWPQDRMQVKPHFLAEVPVAQADRGEYALFVGRLSPEKGVKTLLRAWDGMRDIPLVLRGSGELQNCIPPHIPRTQRLTQAELFELYRGARFLVWPSEGYYESFGLVAVEAFACGIPVIAARTGVAEEIVQDNRTGLFFSAGDSDDLVRMVRWAWNHPSELEEMGHQAREEFLRKYTADANYPQIEKAYLTAMKIRGSARIEA